MLKYVKQTPLRLKGHPDFSEAWLQSRIADDPSILGLGEVDVLARERTQHAGGRLDLLLFDQQQNCRYEVELMLGATDESHIIRTLEYWDIERRRYPGYDHCAVLVAEDITTRFLNVISLFAGTIPIIAIQLSAMQVGDQIVLHFVKVLDRVGLRTDDEEDETTSAADRGYWNAHSSVAVMEEADRVVSIVNKAAAKPYQLNYCRGYVGLTDGGRSRNFILFSPKKQFVYLNVRVASQPEWVAKLEAAGLEAGVAPKRLWITLRPSDVEKHRPILTELLEEAVRAYEQE